MPVRTDWQKRKSYANALLKSQFKSGTLIGVTLHIHHKHLKSTLSSQSFCTAMIPDLKEDPKLIQIGNKIYLPLMFKNNASTVEKGLFAKN